MATWHQSRRPVCWNHPTTWTVVTDPPGEFASGMGFATEAEAKAFLKRLEDRGEGRHSWIAAPKSVLEAMRAANKRKGP